MICVRLFFIIFTLFTICKTQCFADDFSNSERPKISQTVFLAIKHTDKYDDVKNSAKNTIKRTLGEDFERGLGFVAGSIIIGVEYNLEPVVLRYCPKDQKTSINYDVEF